MKKEQYLFLIRFKLATRNDYWCWIVEASSIQEAVDIFEKTSYPESQKDIQTVENIGLNGQITLKETK